MRLVPGSLFGRTMFVLGAGLLLVQLATVLINVMDRGGAVYRLASQQVAIRIAEAAKLLNRVPAADRAWVLEELNNRDLRILLSAKPIVVPQGPDELNHYERPFAASVQRYIGAPWPTDVEITARLRSIRPSPEDSEASTRFGRWFARNFYFLLPDTFTLVTQIRLQDGSTAVFYARVPQERIARLQTLLPRLILPLAIVIALTAVVVGMITRPLGRLAHAADALGANPEGPALKLSGPREVARVVEAFNRMQSQVRGYVQERARMLGAISHDLKTPITRMRLRAEMLPDGELRDKFARDLEEMDAMVGSTLEFFRSLGTDPERRPVDVLALIEGLCEDWRETGAETSVSGAPRAPYPAHPQALRRCLNNLIENALRYGSRADVSIEDDGRTLRVAVRDQGPGIPEDQLERVFEPFFRLEGSRSRESGGVGLGLSIARNIARWHGGDVTLRNTPEGGLTATLTLPRGAAVERPAADS
ncbi:MAG TPA: ATP-binding protein [Burkholderiales bacterium]|nr:ATP-binding protein [Burkholderiales bacterium]